MADIQAYRRLYEDGVVIVDDFFDDPSEATDGSQKDYPKALFKCTPSQATYVTKAGVSRDVVYDAVIRSAVTAGYDSVFGKQDCVQVSSKAKLAITGTALHFNGEIVFVATLCFPFCLSKNCAYPQ